MCAKKNLSHDVWGGMAPGNAGGNSQNQAEVQKKNRAAYVRPDAGPDDVRVHVIAKAEPGGGELGGGVVDPFGELVRRHGEEGGVPTAGLVGGGMGVMPPFQKEIRNEARPKNRSPDQHG